MFHSVCKDYWPRLQPHREIVKLVTSRTIRIAIAFHIETRIARIVEQVADTALCSILKWPFDGNVRVHLTDATSIHLFVLESSKEDNLQSLLALE